MSLLLLLPVGVGAQELPQASADTPAKRFDDLNKRFNKAANGIWNAKTIEERKRCTDEVAVVTHALIALAEQNPTDATALPALVATCTAAISLENNTAYAAGGKNTPEQRAIAQLLRDHLQSEQLGAACDRIGGGFSAECEQFLRQVSRESPHRHVRGTACLKLAQLLYARAQRLTLIATRPDRAKRYESLFGKSFLDSLRRRKAAEAAGEYVALYEQAAREYGDVKLLYRGTVAEQVTLELNEIRRLAVGKPAPEIDGQDQQGTPFKLSDYRGKVVLLYFWQHG